MRLPGWPIPALTLGLIASAALPAPQAPGPLEDLRVDQSRIEQHLARLAAFGTNPEGGVSRVAFSPADIAGRDYVMGLMRAAGLAVRIDAAGNIIGRREGLGRDRPPILTGSHIDSVPHGGNYDGAAGVIGAIECARVLQEHGVRTRHPLEVVVFPDEEGGLVGSRAMAGDLSAEALDLTGHSGLTIREGIKAIGGDPGSLQTAIRRKGDVAAFVELHIEQGSILDDEKTPIGVVEGIVGIQWWDVTIEGFANHAGTTPMNRRQDAMIAAAHLTLAVNRVVTGVPGGQVGTVGRIRAEPGAPNVIPGRVVMSLELRDLSADTIRLLFLRIREEGARIARETGTTIGFAPLDVTAVPAPTDERVRRVIADSAHALGLAYKMMPSGAGHDAQDMARIAPTGMIFIPSVGGISHSPREFSRPQDIAGGADVLLQTILRIDRGGLER